VPGHLPRPSYPCLTALPTTYKQIMEKQVDEHPGGVFNLEHFFPELSMRMFCRFAINVQFDNSCACPRPPCSSAPRCSSV
jgi:hypothetical protein